MDHVEAPALLVKYALAGCAVQAAVLALLNVAAPVLLHRLILLIAALVVWPVALDVHAPGDHAHAHQEKRIAAGTVSQHLLIRSIVGVVEQFVLLAAVVLEEPVLAIPAPPVVAERAYLPLRIR